MDTVSTSFIRTNLDLDRAGLDRRAGRRGDLDLRRERDLRLDLHNTGHARVKNSKMYSGGNRHTFINFD